MKLLRSLVVLSAALLPGWALADQPVYAQGKAEVPYTTPAATPDVKEAALLAAKFHAIEAYYSEQSSALAKNFDANEAEIRKDIDRYVVTSVVLDESDRPDRHKYLVAVRVQLNINRLNTALQPKAAAHEGSRPELAFLFLTRQVATQKSFEDKIARQVDVRSKTASEGSEAQTAKTSEAATKVGGTIDTSAKSSSTHSTATGAEMETGGSVQKIATIETYRLIPSGDFNAAFLQVVNGQDWPYDPIEADTVPELRLKGVQEDFSRGDDIQAQTLQSLVQNLKEAAFGYFAVGTLDVGLPQKTSSGTSVAVTLRSKVYDVTGRHARTIVTVEPQVINAEAEDAKLAQVKAIKLAAQRAASEFLNQLSRKDVH